MAATELNPTRQRFLVPGLRGWIVSLVFLATLICYLDRLTVSVLAPVICSALHLSNLEYAGVNTWFLVAYAGGMTFFGKLHDWVGTRRGYAAAMRVWSLAEAGHALARGLFSLSAFRLGLGIGEAGQWPAATKTAAEWFPTKERALVGRAVRAEALDLGGALTRGPCQS
jgi:MFS transporter, ACS family, aldohexuronate transporter